MRRPDNPLAPAAPGLALSAALALAFAFAVPFNLRGEDVAAEAMRREAAAKKAQIEATFARIKARAVDDAPPAPPPQAVALPAAAPFPQAVIIQRNVVVQRNAAQAIPIFAQQYRPLLRAEYQFLVTVCEPTKDQRREIARAGERGLTLAATKLADWQRVPTPSQVRPGAPGSPDPRAIIQDALAAAANKHLSAAQVARYRKEADERTADRRRVEVQNLVAKLDQVLFLSPDQREKIAESLTSNWDDRWCPSPQNLIFNLATLPQIPDRYVVPALSPAQKKVWEGTTKAPTYVQSGFVAVDGTDNAPLEDAELGEANKPALPRGGVE